jgi:lipoprotein NlpD
MERNRGCPSLGTRLGLTRALLLVVCLVLGACASEPQRTATYTVRRGDTLYSIASRYRVDFKDLARWNGIGRDYVILPGQVLRLAPVRTQASANSSPMPARPVVTPTPRVVAGPAIAWQWPVEQGKATLTTRPNGGQGLTIEGSVGEEIRAASSGRVVYTGSGLLGYGQLIIIKHSETYLSAYGHTQSVIVREGDAVIAGQRIATMGNGPQGKPMLYFEIRINGTPGNPLSLLPQRR